MGSVYAYKDTSGFYTRGPLIYAGPSVHDGLRADCRSVSQWVRLGFLLVLLGCLFHLTGFTTPAWQQPNPYMDVILGLSVTGIGLWQVCGTHEYTSFCVFLQSRDGWHYAVQVLAVIGFVISIIPIALLILYMIRRHLHQRRVIIGCAAGFAFLTGVIILIAVILYGVNVRSDVLGWSFGLSAAGGALFILGTLPLIPDIVRSNKAERERLP